MALHIARQGPYRAPPPKKKGKEKLTTKAPARIVLKTRRGGAKQNAKKYSNWHCHIIHTTIFSESRLNLRWQTGQS